MPQIEHIIVLMLENRSFDHMLGYLKSNDQQQRIEGVQDTFSNPINPDDASSEEIFVSNTAEYVFGPDPGHGLEHTNVQLFGSQKAPQPPQAQNNGFIAQFTERSRGKVEEGREVEKGKEIMKCFAPQRVPVLTQLAHEFVLCDHWFSSVPGPTWPNRFFVHAASSDGETENISIRSGTFRPYRMPTIYDKLFKARKEWRVYFHDIPHVFALEKFRKKGKYRRRVKKIEHFFEAIRRDRLPNYCFIEPKYFGDDASDQHPPHDVRLGENLIADLYEAIRRFEDVWLKSLFIIVYDEHGGFYDHVRPPYDGETQALSIPNPDGKLDDDIDPNDFNFNRLGIRVPAIIVSPLVKKGKVDHTVYEHASVLATVKKLFNTDFINKRDEAANSFEHLLMQSPRNDCPKKLNRPI